MPTVYHSNDYNSTTFTTCCKVAIDTERNCPRCGAEIEPQGIKARFFAAQQQDAKAGG